MDFTRRILQKTKYVDQQFARKESFDGWRIIHQVPSFHPRREVIQSYPQVVGPIEQLNQDPLFRKAHEKILLIDQAASQYPFIRTFIESEEIKTIRLPSVEGKVKTKEYLDRLIKKIPTKKRTLIIVMGGGLLLNVGAYLAERSNADLIQCPTTALSMADGSGGKVRVNVIDSKRAYKHFYKSYYEPNAIYMDPRFLEGLPKRQIQAGLGEIIKHALFQSLPLYQFLEKEGKQLFTNKKKLLKAIIWAAELKKVCLEVDVEENENGSRPILRGGHDYSDRIEEDLRLEIPHGFAVSIGIIHQLEVEKNKTLLKKAKEICNVFEIPTTIQQFKKMKS